MNSHSDDNTKRVGRRVGSVTISIPNTGATGLKQQENSIIKILMQPNMKIINLISKWFTIDLNLHLMSVLPG